MILSPQYQCLAAYLYLIALLFCSHNMVSARQNLNININLISLTMAMQFN